MNKTGICAGHYDGANVIPAQYRTKPEHDYSEGTTMHQLVNAIAARHPEIYNARPEAGTANPWHPNFPERADRLKAAGCNCAFECHTNWSIGSGGKPNRGVFLVIVSLCYEAGASQARACEDEKALAAKLWKPLADELGLKFEIRTRKGGGNWDYYSFINFGKKRGIAHPMIIEHGYHMDFAEHKDEWIWTIADYYDRVQAMIGAEVIPTEPTQPQKPEAYRDFITTADCVTLWSISRKFGVPIESIRLPDGTKPNAGAMRVGMTVRIWYKLPQEPVYFTTTADCYTLYAVGKKFGVDWQDIRLADGSVPNAKAMRIGMKLLIKAA